MVGTMRDESSDYEGLIDGLSFVSLIAPNEELFFKTVSFYREIGFKETFSWDRTSRDAGAEMGICNDSDKETWLHVYGESFDDITLKVRFVRDTASLAHLFNTNNSKDWRGQQVGITLHTERIDLVVNMLDATGISYQRTTKAAIPSEIYVFDPIGTLIGFTCKASPFTRIDNRAQIVRTPTPVITSPTSVNAPSLKRKRIGVMTSGGDAPGMNGAVRAVVRMSIFKGCDPYAIYEGYEGLVQGGKFIRKMGWEDVRGWLSEGGTLIGTARCAAFRERKGRLLAARSMILNGIDALIVCGGDGSLTGADLFRSEWEGLLRELVDRGDLTDEEIAPFGQLNIVGLVGSIDNDMSNTDATIGAFSSLTRICEAVDSIDATAFSHSRAFIIEVMGRHCGWLALMAGLSTGADFIFIPEQPPHGHDWEEKMCESISSHRKQGKRKTIIIVAEGAIDEDCKPISASFVKDLVVRRLGLDTRITTLGHTQRGGTPCAYDRVLATLQGVDAVEAVLSSTPDTPSPMIGIHENKITRSPLVDAVKATHGVAEAIERRDFTGAMNLRDTEFCEYLDVFYATNTMTGRTQKVPDNQNLRIAIIHVGAPAGGMNAATRAAASWCIARGHTPLALHNGFPGLVRHDAVRPLEWLQIDGWAIRGGSEIGTNRETPDIDMGMVAWTFQKHKIDGLLIIGGFEAFVSLDQLRRAKTNYPALRIPMVCLPATISNNVPGSEYSVGSDTCLNALIGYCDAIKQSASASRRRVFVVETQGGRSGYVATVAGLATGALAVYTPEEGINLRMLQKDIDHLRQSFANDEGQNRAGKLILRNEKASKTFTTDFVADIIREEAHKHFEARTAIPGHVQQGGTPSPMDRVRATRLAVKCINHLESFARKTEMIMNDPLSSAVIGVRGNVVKFSPVEVLSIQEADMVNRTPRKAHWKHITQLVNILSGRPMD